MKKLVAALLLSLTLIVSPMVVSAGDTIHTFVAPYSIKIADFLNIGDDKEGFPIMTFEDFIILNPAFEGRSLEDYILKGETFSFRT